MDSSSQKLSLLSGTSHGQHRRDQLTSCRFQQVIVKAVLGKEYCGASGAVEGDYVVVVNMLSIACDVSLRIAWERIMLT